MVGYADDVDTCMGIGAMPYGLMAWTDSCADDVDPCMGLCSMVF